MEENNENLQSPLLNNEKKPAYLKTNIFDTYLLCWVGKLIEIGKRKTFQQDMHWDLRKCDQSNQTTKVLSIEFEKNKNKKNPLVKALFTVTKGLFLKTLFFKLAQCLLDYSSPIFIREIINYVSKEESERDFKTGVFLVVGLILARILIAFASSRSEILFTLLGIHSAKAINGLVYEKSMRFSLMRSVEHSQGSLVNHIQVDSEQLYYLGMGLANTVVLPVSIGIGIYFMWAAVGIAFLAGLGMLILIAGINFFVSKKYMKVQIMLMGKKDERMKVSTEMLNGIKYIKMSGWEKVFLNKVLEAREGELSWQKKEYVLNGVFSFFMWLTPMFIIGAILATYVLIGNPMNAKTAFTLVSTVMILEGAISMLPFMGSMTMGAFVALGRITKYLLANDVNRGYIKQSENMESDIAIKMENGNFYWLTEEEKRIQKEKEKEEKEKLEKSKIGENEAQKPKELKEAEVKVLNNAEVQLDNEVQPALDLEKDKKELENSGSNIILEDINLTIKKGSFVAILGDVGSGKSSFLFSLVGEMQYDQEKPPQVEINGELSYLIQQPWILNNTVKENILFGNDFDQTRYQEAIHYSCLQSDLDILSKKDETEIGEKGVNLSGGQKARVGLARALYKNSDIYLFDDPLSAVDAHVGNFILKECFVKYLGKKTRVLVTHKFESLKYVDYIYIFQKGRIVEEGTLEGLKDSPLFHEIEEKYKTTTKDEENQEASLSTEGDSKLEDKISAEPIEELAPKEGMFVEQQTKTKEEIQKLTAAEDQELQDRLMLDEDRQVGEVGWNVWKSYFKYYGGCGYFVIVFIVMTIFVSIQTATNFWLSYWSDNAENPDYSQGYFLEIYMIFSASYVIFCVIRTSLLFIQSIRCSRKLHKNMLINLLRAPINLFFDRVPTGRILNRLSKDLSVLDTMIAFTFGYMTFTFFGLLADIVVCLILGSVWMFPLALIFFIISFNLQRSYRNLNREVVRLEGISKSPIVSYFSESLNGLSSIRAYQEQERFINKFHHFQNENIKNLIVMAGLLNWFHLRVTSCTILVIAPTVAIPLLITPGSFSVGVIALLITYVKQINDHILYVLFWFSEFETKLISLERCRTFTQIESEAPAITEKTQEIENFTCQWPKRGKIEFKNYYVKYRPNLPFVIKNLSVHINHGEKIGVVGRTGSGKSTLFLSLLRILEPTQGAIYVDDVDISKLGLDDLRRKMTIIPQDPMLFKGTLRNNLDLLGTATHEELWQSLEKVCMKEKFMQENGLATEIKEGGENLSAGEKQLLCIGRAILAKSKIILIDEATSNIDPKTEQTILDTIHNSFKDCTVITIAHRLKTIINSDKIMVMGEGELLEYGNPQSLIDDQGHFHKLWIEHEHGSKK